VARRPHGPGRPVLLVGGIAAALAAAPVAVVGALAATGRIGWEAAVLVALIVAAIGLVAGVVLHRELVRLAHALDRAEAGRPPDDLPRLPPLRRLAEAAGRLAQSLRARAHEVDRLARGAGRIVESLPDPLIVLDAEARPTVLNAAAREIFTPPGGRAPDLGALLRHPALRAALDRVAADGTAESVAVTLPVPVERELIVHAIGLEPEPPDRGRIVLVLSDRTRERRIEQMRADFVANANHELRTPLASLIGFIETLRGPAAEDREAQARFLAIMAEQAQRMSRLIDDMLSLSRIEMTEHTPPKGSADLAVLARRSAEALEPRFAARRMRIELQIADGVRPIVADQDQIAQVLANLLDNAAKYGREGGRVVIRVAPAPPHGGRPPGITVAVSDDGPGIPRQHIPRLTERFYRVDAARSRAIGGTGLGLAIVKHILNRHRGSLEIASEEGKGATFTVWLPAAEPEAGAATRG
jgi:two-component system phosphate regulon sensor histidine kinase PhoR